MNRQFYEWVGPCEYLVLAEPTREITRFTNDVFEIQIDRVRIQQYCMSALVGQKKV